MAKIVEVWQEFKPIRIYAKNNDTIFYRGNEINGVHGVQLVTITDQTANQVDIANPNADIFVYLSCENALGATFDIVCDIAVTKFHPVRRYGEKQGRLTSTLKPKGSVDLTLMNIDDADFIKEIIKRKYG